MERFTLLFRGATVGMLTLNADDDYERGESLIKN